MSDITVLTSITGGKHNLVDAHAKGDAKWVAYVDDYVAVNSDGTPKTHPLWKLKPAYHRFNSSRRNSRIPKILSHLYTDTKYSIWLDGNLKLLVPPEELVEKHLRDHDIAAFQHPDRDCIYDEAMVCAQAYLDIPDVIIEQVRRYEIDGYAKRKGLCDCRMILRRHTPKVEQFTNLWWAEYCRGSVRDQISFMYAADRAGIRVNVITEPFKELGGSLRRGGIIEVVEHLTPRAEP